MKISAPLTIYIASSASRNIHAVCMLGDHLREMGHTVLDWTGMAMPLASSLPPAERRAALNFDERGEIFVFCSEACARADLVIYLGPAGQDAGCEIGMAFASGVPVFGLAGILEAPGLMLARAVTRWCANVDELLLQVGELARGRAPV
ncbi:MAG: translation initiation factor 2 [Desulfovibrionaceae bacterium]|nr:translation initiation factor 2 [Desulfovibrionaceae bacterium]